jgi:DnaJ family protein C protein 2
LVDNAYACDPRISKFKENEKLRKEEEKKKKQELRELHKKQEEERIRKEEEAALVLKQQEEEELKAKRDSEKREREAMKKNRKKVRKAIETVVESCSYFQTASYTKLQALLDMEKIFQTLSFEELETFKNSLEEPGDLDTRKEKFLSQVKKLNVSQTNGVSNGVKEGASVDQNSNVSSTKKWTVDDCFLLTKAAKIFPPGTQERWSVITAYFNQHSTTGVTRKVKEVMSKSKELQDPSKNQLISLLQTT